MKYAWKSELRPGKRAEYVKYHDELWPDMAQVLAEAGIRNYTIWNLDEQLFGYYECDDVDFAARVQAESEVVQRWNACMEPLMTGTVPMQQVFSFQ